MTSEESLIKEFMGLKVMTQLESDALQSVDRFMGLPYGSVRQIVFGVNDDDIVTEISLTSIVETPCRLRIPSPRPLLTNKDMIEFFVSPGSEWNKARFFLLIDKLTGLQYDPVDECVWGKFSHSLQPEKPTQDFLDVFMGAPVFNGRVGDPEDIYIKYVPT